MNVLPLLIVLLTFAIGGCSKPLGEVATASKVAGEAGQRVAQAAEESGDLALAEQLYAQASAAAPSDAAVQLRYADILMRRGRINEARDLLSKRLQTVSDPLELHDGLGSVYVLTGDPIHAVTEFDLVLAAKPNDIRAVVNKGIALDLLGRHTDAQALYRQALTLSPGDQVVINDLALSMLLAGRPQEAEQVAAPLRGQTDVLPRIRTGLGIVLAANGDVAGAGSAAGTQATQAQLVQLAKAAASSAH
ncbi:MAG TPA: tetratricopeptide repeat protein [Acetobacteraceae bacterium]|jgi:Flp pilus assembly protein TadD|nr:tetratricopeptide repeat protein [Acetobacteraceae bacterium]